MPGRNAMTIASKNGRAGTAGPVLCHQELRVDIQPANAVYYGPWHGLGVGSRELRSAFACERPWAVAMALETTEIVHSCGMGMLREVPEGAMKCPN